MQKGLFTLLLLVCLIKANSQTPGALITTHIPSTGLTLLNPGDNSWVTTSGSAFVTNDQDESEIGWVGIPQVNSEPSGDLNVGGACGATDIMDDPTSGADASYVYFSDPDGIPDNGDEYMFYRLRISRDPGNGNFGFSVLIDIDETFGHTDVDSVEGNPGFEAEIRVVNGGGSKGVYIEDVSGTTSGSSISSYNLNLYTQRSYALSQQAACSGKQAVFYDFIVPFSDLSTHFGISVNDPIRLVGATSINGATVLGNTASDIAGIDDDNYANSIAGQDAAFSTFINAQSAVSSKDATGFGVLPVELISYNAEKIDGLNIVSWTTGMEQGNDYFSIEKSINGVDFKSIGEVSGAGVSNTEVDYSFVDYESSMDAYYRLKQVDFDGAYEYSPVAFVRGKHEKAMTMKIKESGKFIKINPGSTSSTLEIYNIYGALVKKKIVSDVSIVNYSDLPLGIYTVVVSNLNNNFSQKFINK